MAISSLGVGSGLDIQGLVSSLVSAEGAGKSARLDRKEVDYQAKLSIMGSIKSALNDFQDTYSQLKLTSSFKSYTASSSDTSAFTAMASNGAELASYSITIDQIAQAHKLKSIEQADKTTSIGTGTLQFVQGDGTTTDVDISDGSLEGIRDAINDANFGVDASIIYNGSGYVLSLASDLGTDKAISSITATTTTTGSLANFETGADPAVNLSDIQTAKDAIFSVNGVSITSQTNTITNIIDNVTINLLEADGGVSTETLTVGRDTSSVKEAVQSFIDGYNDLISGLNSATFYDADTEESGVLIGDPTVRGIVNQLRSVLNTTTGDSATEFNSFASIGILTTRDGTLEFDSTKLDAALLSKPEEVQQLLAGGKATVSNSDTEIISITDNIGEGSYIVDITSVPLRGTHQGGEFTPNAASFDLSAEADLSFSVVIDGIASGALSIAALDYTGVTDLDSGKNIAAAIQAAINNDATTNNRGYSSVVTFEDSSTTPGDYVYKIASAQYGSTSSIEFIPGGASTLGNFLNTVGNVGAAETGTDGAGTIGNLAATFDGNRMTGSGIYAGFVLDVNGGSTGYRTINVTAGNINKLDSLVDSFLDSDGLITSKTNGLNASIDDINSQREALALRLDALETRLIKQFSAMDSLVAQLNSTSTFLTNQLEQVANIGKK